MSKRGVEQPEKFVLVTSLIAVQETALFQSMYEIFTNILPKLAQLRSGIAGF